jgi:hypothetical protein
MKLRIGYLLLAVALMISVSAAASAAARDLPIPPMYSASSPPTQFDQDPIRQHAFKADKLNSSGFIESTVVYSYVGTTQPMPMVDQGYEETIAKDIRNEEKRLQGNPNYLGKTEFLGGTLFVVKIPPPPDGMIGKPGPEKHDGTYYEKLGRGMLVIRLTNIQGGEGRMKELIDYMRRGTEVCN